ncbi:MAG: glycosyltransferase [Salinivirgaceae bacterium]|jgi:glycosyltransferase involved in cell wall biosynthesis|nr:glycosyltransferase [Salinivirgaceae bacterium]
MIKKRAAVNILMLLEKEFPHDIRVEKEIDTLIKAGHSVSIATISHKRLFEKEEMLTTGCQVFRRKISNVVFKSSVGCLKFPIYFNFWRNYIRDILSTHAFDAIHVHDLPLAKIGYEMKREFKLHFVLDLHENWPAAMEIAHHTNTFMGRILSSNKQWRNYEKKMTHLADAVVVVVQEMGDRIHALGVNRDMIYEVENTLTDAMLDSFSGNSNPEFLTLFYSGGINKHRGLQIVINALPKVITKYPKMRLWIVGDGSYVHHLRHLAQELQVADYVTFHGHKPYKEVFSMLMKSDIALIPHLKSEQTDNSSPNKLYEYMLSNKPILTSNCKSVQRVVETEKIGVTYEHDNPDDFVNKLSVILNNRDALKGGFSVLKKKYLWSITEQNLIALYKNL